MKFKSLWLLTPIVAMSMTGCYYDNYEDLYQHVSNNSCDTVLSSYTADIKPWIDAQCISCHDANLASGGLVLETYQQVADNADVIKARIELQEGELGLMPQGGPRLDECKLNGFQAWIDLGKPEN